MKKNVLLFLLNNKKQNISNLGTASKFATVITSFIIATLLFMALQVMFYFSGENKLDNIVLLAVSALTLVVTVATTIFSVLMFCKLVFDKTVSFSAIRKDFSYLFQDNKKIIIPFIFLYTQYAIRNFTSFIHNSNINNSNEYSFVVFLMNSFSNKDLQSFNKEHKLFSFHYFFSELIVKHRKYKNNEDISVVLYFIKDDSLFPNRYFSEDFKNNWVNIINKYKLTLVQSKISNF
jgi:hypothetical protein